MEEHSLDEETNEPAAVPSGERVSAISLFGRNDAYAGSFAGQRPIRQQRSQG